jgi:hypothetical protein
LNELLTKEPVHGCCKGGVPGGMKITLIFGGKFIAPPVGAKAVVNPPV